MLDRKSLPWLLPLLAFLTLFLGALQWNYPFLGHDYHYHFPRMIAGWWHAEHQGLWPFRYAVHFCGGLPEYGNPSDLFYSLPQFLSFVVGLWPAVLASQLIMLIVGYAGWHRFGRDIVSLPSLWSHVLALVILSNGFLLMHAIVGHLAYQTVPLIGWILCFLLDREHRTLPALLRLSAAFGLLMLVILSSAGYFTIILAGLAFLPFLPFEFLFSKVSVHHRIRELALRIAVGGGIALLLSGSKLVAVGSVMRHFPRLVPFASVSTGHSAIALALRALFAFPQSAALFPASTYDAYAFEQSVLISPIVIVGLVAAAFALVQQTRPRPLRTATSAVVAILIATVFLGLVSGGSIAAVLHHLPIFSSLRITTRFLYVPALLLSIAGVWGLRHIAGKFPAWEPGGALAASIVTLLAFVAGNAPLLRPEPLFLTMDYNRMQSTLEQSERTRSGPVETVIDDKKIADITYPVSQSTGANCYEPLITGQAFPNRPIGGPVELVRAGSFNLFNPACFAYPEENGCRPGDRIAVTDRANFEAFRSGAPVTWKLSLLQRLADIVTLAGIAGSVGVLVML